MFGFGKRLRFGPGVVDSGERVVMVPLDLIHENPVQPRRIFDRQDMDRLKASIRHLGVIVPVLLRRLSGGEFELVGGERRWRACKELQMKRIPALVRKLEDATMAELSLVENMVRSNLTGIEEAHGLKRILSEFQRIDKSKLQELLGVSEEQIAIYDRLATLPVILKQALYARLITEDHILPLEGIRDENKLSYWVARIAAEKLSPLHLRRLLAERPHRLEREQTVVAG